jgi:hypothetical protein
LQNHLFAQNLRYAQNFILGISTTPEVKFFACLDFQRKSPFCKRLFRYAFLLNIAAIRAALLPLLRQISLISLLPVAQFTANWPISFDM